MTGKNSEYSTQNKSYLLLYLYTFIKNVIQFDIKENYPIIYQSKELDCIEMD